MSEADFLIAKAFGRVSPDLVRRHEDLSNRELDQRMRVPVGQVAGAAGYAVPGAGNLAGVWGAEKKFRVTRNARKAEARSIQRSEQRQRYAAAGTGLGLGVAGSGLGGLKSSIKTRSVRKPARVGAGLGLAGGSALIGLREGKKKAKVEHRIWNRMLERDPEGRS